MLYKNHVISTQNERLTSGFKPLDRPTHVGCDYIDGGDAQITPRGVDILAYADGTVTNIYYTAARGHVIDIAHNSRYTTRYQHLRSGITLKIGDKVKQGQVIAVMGNTGSCSSSRKDVPKAYLGTHLHFEVIVGGEPVNPEPYLLGEKSISSIGVAQPVQATQATHSVPTRTQKQQQSSQVTNNTAFKPGDKVKVKGGALKYVTGETIPDWVKGRADEVYQNSKDGKSVLLKNIWSWVSAKDLTKI